MSEPVWIIAIAFWAVWGSLVVHCLWKAFAMEGKDWAGSAFSFLWAVLLFSFSPVVMVGYLIFGVIVGYRHVVVLFLHCIVIAALGGYVYWQFVQPKGQINEYIGYELHGDEWRALHNSNDLAAFNRPAMKLPNCFSGETDVHTSGGGSSTHYRFLKAQRLVVRLDDDHPLLYAMAEPLAKQLRNLEYVKKVEVVGPNKRPSPGPLPDLWFPIRIKDATESYVLPLFTLKADLEYAFFTEPFVAGSGNTEDFFRPESPRLVSIEYDGEISHQSTTVAMEGFKKPYHNAAEQIAEQWAKELMKKIREFKEDYPLVKDHYERFLPTVIQSYPPDLPGLDKPWFTGALPFMDELVIWKIPHDQSGAGFAARFYRDMDLAGWQVPNEKVFHHSNPTFHYSKGDEHVHVKQLSPSQKYDYQSPYENCSFVVYHRPMPDEIIKQKILDAFEDKNVPTELLLPLEREIDRLPNSKEMRKTFLDRLLKEDSPSVDVLEEIGESYRRLDQPLKSWNVYKKALAMELQTRGKLHNFGIVRALQRLVEKFPNDEFPETFEVLMKQNQFEFMGKLPIKFTRTIGYEDDIRFVIDQAEDEKLICLVRLILDRFTQSDEPYELYFTSNSMSGWGGLQFSNSYSGKWRIEGKAEKIGDEQYKVRIQAEDRSVRK